MYKDGCGDLSVLRASVCHARRRGKSRTRGVVTIPRPHHRPLWFFVFGILVRIAESNHLHAAVTEISVQGTRIIEMTRWHTRTSYRLV
jgi:hypothetical protein